MVLAVAPVDYPKLKAHFAELRTQTQERYRQAANDAGRAQVLSQARAELISRFETELFPAWAGTEWDFNGITQTPRQGKIACGYYVSTLLRDAGFQVERVKLAQQASAKIARTVAAADRVHWYRETTVEQMLPKLRADTGEGLYVVGLPNHVVFLRVNKDSATVCHANYLEDVAVTCEDAATAPALKVDLFVTAPLFDDAMLKQWLDGAAIPTVTR
ncbi:MAG: hypothetical protein QM723_28970 [Myxococcaceae bacterium]